MTAVTAVDVAVLVPVLVTDDDAVLVILVVPELVADDVTVVVCVVSTVEL